MSKVLATIELGNGKVVTHSFDEANMKHVYRTCRKELGKALATTMENGKVFWQFADGRVSLVGTGFRHKHGYYTKRRKK